MNIARFFLILLPLVVIVFYGKVLFSVADDDLNQFESKPLPEFFLLNLEGNPVDVSNLAGIKLLNVWASWCITCLVEHPYLSELSSKGFDVIGLNYKDSSDKAQNWLNKYGNPYQFSIYDPRGDLAFDLGVTGAPETFLVVNSQVIEHIQGELTKKKWETIFLPRILAAQGDLK